MRVRLPCAVITRKHTRKDRETKSSKKPSEDETIRSAAPSIAASDPVFVFPGPLERKGRPSSSVNARPVRCCVRALLRLAAGLVYFVWPRWGRAVPRTELQASQERQLRLLVAEHWLTYPCRARRENGSAKVFSRCLFEASGPARTENEDEEQLAHG